MPIENQIQSLVHRLEEGGWAKWIRLGASVAAVLTLSYLWLFGANGFKGLAHARVFEQAGIAREIARGHGFTTKVLRPAALYQFREYERPFDVERLPDTYHAPLWPLILSPFMAMMKSTWEMSVKEVLYPSDRMVALVALLFFIAAVVVNFFIARRLFDHRLAVISTALLLLCDRLWQYAMTGLPQMLMLFLFSCAMYAMLRAVELYEEIRPLSPEELEEELRAEPSVRAVASMPPSVTGDAPSVMAEPVAGVAPHRRLLPWLSAVAALFGLLALTHAITIWIFAGLLLFCFFYFRPFGLYAAVMLAIFACFYTPWLMRNYHVCGSPFGVSWYSVLSVVRGTEDTIMRSMDPPLSGVSPTFFKRKILSQADYQLGDLFLLLGSIVAAPFFFIALLHVFRRRSTSVFRWCVLLCWLAALLGMSVFGLEGGPYKSNDLHVLFIPLLTFYGLAFILVLWSRLEIRVPIARVAFMFALFAISDRQFVVTFLDLLSNPTSRVQWPPYVPPYIAILANWTKENEIITSDMPWAVSWYADRRSLWLPMAINDFVTLNDWDVLQSRIVGLYLTPVSGDSPFLSQVVKGDYKEWAPFIMRSANLRAFPLKAVTPLPIDSECIFYADRDRWTLRED